MLRMLWKKAAEIAIADKIPLTIYHSKRSNLRVAVANVPGPMVRGHISFVTEAHTDDGLPHTLEHLVFMGSKMYPYKGVLDIIANRCLASGTNAHTDQDHTAYTLSTAGSSGFLKVLPVYLDHLLSPNLTDSQYLTEVHHIDGKGQDSGVVYSEMQDHETEMETLVDKKRKEIFYPKGSSYATDTGGSLPNLRERCSPEKVRQYHKDFYHLSNMLITVCGIIDHSHLLTSIDPVEQRNLPFVPKSFTLPFQARVPPLNEPRNAKIVCPSDDESIGMVEMSWLGPPASDFYTTRALLILFDYLSDTAVAPLKKDFVQLEDPYCSSVHVSMLEQRDCELVMGFQGVPVAKLEQIQDRFFDKTVVDHDKPSAFDLERIGFILDQQIRLFLSKLENNASSMIIDALVGHQMYGQEEDPEYTQLAQYLDEESLLRRLKAEPAEFWHSLFQKYFTRNCACVIAEPSEDEVERVAAKEEKRINDQVGMLKEEGLERCGSRLEEAVRENTCNKPSDEVLRDLIVRDFERFNLIDVQSSTNFSPSQSADFVQHFPMPTVIHSVDSNFVEATILIDLDGIATEDRYFLMLWFELMFQSPAIVDGQVLDYEEVAKLSTKELVSNSVGVGVSGVYDRFMLLKLRVDTDNYEKIAKWAQIYLRGIRFEPKKVAICAKKLANRAADVKRDGNSVCHALNTSSAYTRDANTRFYSYLALEKFHKTVAKAAEDKRADKVLKRLEDLREKALACPVNVHLAGDTAKLQSHAESNRHWAFLGKEAPKQFLQCSAEYGSDWGLLGQSRGVAVGGSESAFLIQKTEFGEDWNGESTMQTLLLAQYLCQCEGPLWNAVRGNGLAYDVSIYLMPDRKALSLSLYRCSQLSLAYSKTRDTVLSILDGKLDEDLLEAAKRSLVCQLIGGQSTVKLTVTAAILASIRSVGPDFTMTLCSRIWRAQPEDVLLKGAPAIRRLFDSQKAIRSIAFNPSRRSELEEAFPGTKVVKMDELQVKDVIV